MNKKLIVTTLACVLAAGVLLPAAQASHYTLYHSAGLHAEIGSFETTTTDGNNKNGPEPDDSRAVPSDGDVPARFVGLADILESGSNGAGFTGVLDHQMYGSTVEAGHVVPYGYYVGAAGGQPRTTPTSIHALWFGYWNDRNGDGIIDDEWCEGNPGDCGAGVGDEFIWRGQASGETFSALAYIFPGDYDGSTGVSGLGHTEPSALAGDCTLFEDNAGCISPGPDMAYADSTENDGNSLNQRWAGNNGGGQVTAEEFLLVSQHVVSVVGPRSLQEGSPEQFKVDCAETDGCFRDYDWYQALAGDDVDDLYTGAVRATARDLVWVPVEHLDLGVVGDALEAEACPVQVPSEFYGCVADTRHTDAVGVSGATYKAWTRQTFDTVVGAVGTPALGPLPPQGFYGDLDVERNTFAPYSSYAPGAFLRVNAEAWLWDDANGDGYIGDPSDTELQLYALGLDNSPNDNGDCDAADGGDCELIPRADVYDGKTAIVTPGPGGWPPGAMQINNYEQGYWGLLGVPSPPGGWLVGPLSGNAAASLRMDIERCSAQYFACRSLDAVFIPTGSATGLNGDLGTVSVGWTESATPFNVDFTATWSASI